MPYPRSNPVRKHDIISSKEVSLSRTHPTLPPQKLIKQASVSDPNAYNRKISTIYTYDDAPSIPKPMSARLFMEGFCDLDSIGLSSYYQDEPSIDGLTTCHFGVKRGDMGINLAPKDVQNSQNFKILCQQLRDSGKCAFFSCPSTKKGGFLVAMADGEDGKDYAVYCLVADLDSLDGVVTNIANGNGNGTSNGIESAAGHDDNGQGEEAGGSLWKPPTNDQDDEDPNEFDASNLWQPSTPPIDDNKFDGNETMDTFQQEESHDNENGGGDQFHANKGAAAADEFYSNLTRSLNTRADSMLYHMRNFNGWVKATQIAELEPLTSFDSSPSSSSNSKKRKRTKHPLRVLDLACGKGGDLGKWVLHKWGIANYVGIDVARGSLVDAAERARKMRQGQLPKCVFTCADLGADVPGRIKSKRYEKMQKLSSWSLEGDDGMGDPTFRMVRGGGISENDTFDVVSIQFAIHYMMQSVQRARRFFHTVSQLLEIGGNLIATTIDARVVIAHMMDTGYNFHFDDTDESLDDEHLVVAVGNNACQLKFHRDTVKRIFQSNEGNGDEKLNPDHFGLEYTFTLVEGQDHAAGVGQAVDLPEWLTPLPVLTELAREAGLVLEYAKNFHEFYDERKNPLENHASHGALYNMSVLNRSGTISGQEWEISRMYMAVKFRKEYESTIVIEDEDGIEIEEGSDEDDEVPQQKPNSPVKKQVHIDMNDPRAKSMFVMAMSKAKKSCGELWQSMSGNERNAKTMEKLAELMTK